MFQAIWNQEKRGINSNLLVCETIWRWADEKWPSPADPFYSKRFDVGKQLNWGNRCGKKVCRLRTVVSNRWPALLTWWTICASGRICSDSWLPRQERRHHRLSYGSRFNVMIDNLIERLFVSLQKSFLYRNKWCRVRWGLAEKLIGFLKEDPTRKVYWAKCLNDRRHPVKCRFHRSFRQGPCCCCCYSQSTMSMMLPLHLTTFYVSYILHQIQSKRLRLNQT